MHRRIWVWLVVAVAGLCMTAPVAAQSDELVVGAVHTDFGTGDETTPTKTENLTTKGSGDSASLALEEGTLIDDGFEDEPADFGPPQAWANSSTSVPDAINVTTQRARSGTQSMYVKNGRVHPEDHPLATPQRNKVNISIWASDRAGILLRESGSTRIQVEIKNGDLVYYDGASFNTIATAPDSKEWVDIEIYNIDPSADTFAVKWTDAQGNSGTATGLAMASNMADGYQSIQLAVVNGYAFYDDVYQGGTVDKNSGQYISANYSIEGVKEGFTNFTVSNATVTVEWQYHDGTSWVVANKTTWTSGGNRTIPLGGHESRTEWRVNVTVQNQTTNGKPSFALYDEGLRFVNDHPTVENASASPDDTKLDSRTANLSVPVRDPEFGSAQGESVTVEFKADGNVVHTTTISSNQTVNYSHTYSGGGEHNWSVTATDSYNGVTPSQEFTAQLPGELRIFNETAPSQLLSNVKAEIQFFSASGDDVVERSTSDGTINMTGLPVTKEFTIVISADGYYTRRVYIESLFQQQTAYMLNSTSAVNIDTVSLTYVLDDKTGKFPPSDTTLRIQKPITKDFDGDGSDETRYKTVTGDYFGAVNEFPADLQSGTRYRLVVENRQGDRRDLGSHTVDSGGTVTVPIGQVTFDGDTRAGVAIDTGFQERNGTRYVSFRYHDERNATTELQYEIVRANNSSKKLVSNTTVNGPLGTYSLTEQVPSSAPDGVTYEIRFHANRSGERDVGGLRYSGEVAEVAAGLPIDAQVLQLTGLVFGVALTGLVVIFDDRLAAVTSVVVVTAMTWVGVLNIPTIALLLAASIAVIFIVGRGVTA